MRVQGLPATIPLVQHIPVPQASPTHGAQVHSWKFALLFTLLGLLGFSRFLPGSSHDL